MVFVSLVFISSDNTVWENLNQLYFMHSIYFVYDHFHHALEMDEGIKLYQSVFYN